MPAFRVSGWGISALALLFSLLTGNAEANGFEVRPAHTKTKDARAQAKELHDSGTLQTLAEALNEILVLPTTVGVRVEECEEANAFYDPEKRQISMCVELMEDMMTSLAEQYDEEDIPDVLAGAYVAVILHEAGHALVDVLDIPITGREEDAVDQLSAWILIESDDVDSVLSAAASYYTEDEEIDEDAYADEHSLNRQRYFNLLCWAYGSDPDNGQDLIDDWGLTEARAERCEQEYSALDRSWSALLAEHIRPDEERPVQPAKNKRGKPPAEKPADG